MIPYSLHVALILAICLAFYKLLLQKETYYRLNRAILLGCLALAFVLPLIPVPQQFSLGIGQPSLNSEPVQIISVNTPLPSTENFKDAGEIKQTSVKQQAVLPAVKPTIPEVPLMERILKWVLWLYWCGVAAFGANLLVQVIALLLQAYKKPAIQDGIFRIVELDTDKAPCSFGNSIFINPEKYDWETYNQILLHEKVHIQQGHSLDLILAEMMLVVQWFNPFAWLYRKELESNLEFLTDDEVLQHNEVAIADYQMSLLKVSVPNFSMRITTNYNQSLLKKRIIMMNAKRSNIHTMWKYFMLMPLLVVLVCGLNKPIAVASPLQQTGRVERGKMNTVDMSHGTWYATIKNDKIEIEFKADDNDENHSWSSSSNFKLSDFPSLPKGTKGDFSLTREAGTVAFNGSFDGDQGIGHYKFTPNKEYIDYMNKQHLSGNEEDIYFSFFMMDVKKEYVAFLKANGFNDLTKGQVISMSALKVDADYINFWKKIGYKDLRPQQLVSLKALKIDEAYVNDIRKAGYIDLTIQQLISFKAQHITGEYINGLKKARIKTPGSTDAIVDPTPREIISSKAMNVDSAYVAGTRRAGYKDLSYGQLSSMKSMNISPEYIKSFEAVGYKDIPYNTLITMKSSDVTPADVKGFKDLGYADSELPRLLSLKRQGVTAEYIKSFESVGYKNMPANTVAMFKIQKITPEYIKGFRDIGYETLPINSYWMLKQQGVTPEYLKGFQALGFKDLPLNSFYGLKSITPDYVKNFQNLGFKAASLQQFSQLKMQGVTPEFAAGFTKLGFTDIRLNDLTRLKISGVTPEFVTEMKQKGFDSKDINKYIQLKNFNSDADNNYRIVRPKKVIAPQGQNNN